MEIKLTQRGFLRRHLLILKRDLAGRNISDFSLDPDDLWNELNFFEPEPSSSFEYQSRTSLSMSKHPLSPSFLLIKVKKIQAWSYFELVWNSGSSSLEPEFFLQPKSLVLAFEPDPRLVPPLTQATFHVFIASGLCLINTLRTSQSQWNQPIDNRYNTGEYNFFKVDWY